MDATIFLTVGAILLTVGTVHYFIKKKPNTSTIDEEKHSLEWRVKYQKSRVKYLTHQISKRGGVALSFKVLPELLEDQIDSLQKQISRLEDQLKTIKQG